MEKLLDKFYEGTCSEEEEKCLKETFRTEGNDLPAHLQQAGRLWRAVADADEVMPSVPHGLEERLGCLIDERAGEEQRSLHPRWIHRNQRWVGGIAATLLLAVGFAYSLLQTDDYTPKDTYTDPREAYLALQATLREVSYNLNSGFEQFEEARQEAVLVTQEIRNDLKR